MRIIRHIIWLTIMFLAAGCAPFDKIYSHDFDDGYFRLKSPGEKPQSVYLNLADDSIEIFPVINGEKNGLPDTVNYFTTDINSIKPGKPFYGITFIRTSADIDLSTVLLKFRPSAGDVPPQLCAHVNGVFYAGYRKDYFKIKSSYSKLHEISSFIRHTGIDFGFFAGIGITPVNPTVTMDRVPQEYDGIVFQRGVSVFATYENMSIGVALGFDNLLDKNKDVWIFNNKPWLGLMLGIANF